MKNVINLGIVEHDTKSLKIVGNPSYVEAVHILDSFNKDKLVKLGESYKDSKFIGDDEDNEYYVTYNVFEGIEENINEEYYMLIGYDTSKISEEKIIEIFNKNM